MNPQYCRVSKKKVLQLLIIVVMIIRILVGIVDCSAFFIVLFLLIYARQQSPPYCFVYSTPDYGQYFFDLLLNRFIFRLHSLFHSMISVPLSTMNLFF